MSRLGVQVDTMDTVRPAYLLGIHSLIPSLFRKTRVRRILAEEGRRVAAAALLPTSLMAKDVCTIKHEMYVIGEGEVAVTQINDSRPACRHLQNCLLDITRMSMSPYIAGRAIWSVMMFGMIKY